MDDFAQARTHMVDSQIHTAGVNAARVLSAFETVPRERFVPERLKQIAYCDNNLSVGEERFLLNPMVHARMVQALEPAGQDIALDIGGGTGYGAAILSSLVMTVVAIDESTTCLDQAAKIWSDMGICNIAGVQGRHAEGAPSEAPFNVIFMNGAVSEIPERLTAQLAIGGRLTAILRKPGAAGGRAVLVRRSGEHEFSSRILFDATCPYIPGFESEPAFSF